MMDIKVLGTGCKKCKKLEANTRAAVSNLGIEAKVEKVEDIVKIASYGLMKTPALLVDNKIVVSGKLPSTQDIEKILDDIIKK